MAPEQHEGRFSAESDIYALGITAYEMLTGDLPFRGQNIPVMKKAKTYKALPERIPEGLRRLVSSCLEPDPKKRPQGAAAMMAELARLA